MILGYAQSKHRSSLMEMWKLCFHDTEEFIDFYFNKIYKKEETVILLENDMIVSSLQIIPYEVKIGEKAVNAGYISGAMTYPEYQKKGYMSRLLSFAFDEMKKKGYAFTFLIPQEEKLIDYYTKFGYEEAFPTYFKNIKFTERRIPVNTFSIIENLSGTNWIKCYNRYAKFLSEKENVVLKSRQQFKNMLQDLFIDGGLVFFNEKGIAFVSPLKDRILVKEIFYSDVTMLEDLISCIQNKMDKDKFVFMHYDQGKYRLSGMIKKLDKTFVFPQNIYMSMMLD